MSLKLASQFICIWNLSVFQNGSPLKSAALFGRTSGTCLTPASTFLLCF